MKVPLSLFSAHDHTCEVDTSFPILWIIELRPNLPKDTWVIKDLNQYV